MELVDATATQTRIARMLQEDLRAIGVRTHPELRVTFGSGHLDDGDLGWCDDAAPEVAIRADLAGGMLYFTLLHEIGHSLGLGHTAKGVMAAYDGSETRRLTLRNRRKWLQQLLRHLTNKRLQDLQ